MNREKISWNDLPEEFRKELRSKNVQPQDAAEIYIQNTHFGPHWIVITKTGDDRWNSYCTEQTRMWEAQYRGMLK